MDAKNLLRQIHASYIKSTPGLTEPDNQAISDFCAYANNWLQNAGIIGLGYSADGMALRLKSGDEIPFVSTQPHDVMLTASVGITGNSAGVSTSTGDKPRDIAITGF